MSSNGGSTWSVIGGATSDTYTVTASWSLNDYLYRATFTNASGSVTTQAAVYAYIQNSNNWAGYVESGGTYSAISGSWTVPTATCTSTTTQAVEWVGIDGYGSSTVEQDGTDVACSGGHAVYSAWYEMYGDASVNSGYMVAISSTSYPVHPGDVITASVSVSGETWTLSLHNSTANWTFSIPIVDTTPPSQASAEWIVETPGVCSGTCSLSPLTNFGTVTFTNASVTSGAGTTAIQTGEYLGLDVTDSGGATLMYPGSLFYGGAGFIVTWEESS